MRQDTNAAETLTVVEVARELNRIQGGAVAFLNPTTRVAWLNRLAARADALGAFELAARARSLRVPAPAPAARPHRRASAWA